MNEEKQISERYKENALHLPLFVIITLISFGVWDEPTCHNRQNFILTVTLN